MIAATYYDISSGEIGKTLTAEGEDNPVAYFELNAEPGTAWVFGAYDADQFHFDDGQMVERPARPGPWAIWDGEKRIDPRTEATVAADAQKVRTMVFADLRDDRDRRLLACDGTQVRDGGAVRLRPDDSRHDPNMSPDHLALLFQRLLHEAVSPPYPLKQPT
ncbi:hypothetical protein [Paracoccus beibuensis]|uniref:hypothetical protein n=1 Tax=Paracoccus beibuensis TaxID=547602 RepID=UPI002240BF0B|nr:hypothetical protein [Paracoccus beibuensis]